MKKKTLKLLVLFGLALFLLVGCAVGPRAESTPGLAANDSHVFISAANKIYKVDLATGIETWRYPSDNSRMMAYAPVLLNDETFVLGDMYNALQALNIEAPSTKIWQFTGAKGWYQAKVAESDGIVVAPNTDRNIYGVNATDGSLRWTHEGKFAFLAEPLIVGDTVIVSSQDHEILWLDLNTGEMKGEPFQMKGAVIAKPFYLEETGCIYVGGLGNEFVAINTETHKELWRYEGNNEIEKLSGIWAPPIFIQDHLIFNDDLGNIISLNPKTGIENWHIREHGKMLAGLAAIGDDRFIVASEDGKMIVFDIDRKPIITIPPIEKAKIYTTPLVTDELIIIAPLGAENLLYAFSLEYTGGPTWTFKPAR